MTLLAVALAGLASGTGAFGAPPELLSIAPPGVAIGGREWWTIEGKNLGQFDRVDLEGEGTLVGFFNGNGVLTRRDVRTVLGATPGVRAVRVEGAEGFSNLKLVRIDRLTQTAEIEPNDTPGQATPLPRGSAGVGKLTPQDVDHFRIEANKEERVTIEIEARRLGVAMAPVLTVMTPDGRSLFQGRETPGVEGDCRFLYRFPARGAYVIQVRDNVYGGTDGMSYRLRVTAEPFATGLFPLGGPPGRSLTVSASGGNLNEPTSQTLELPDRPGTILDVPPFRVPGGSLTAPGRVVVGDGPERSESADGNTPLLTGVTVNARIEKPGEADRFRLAVKAGESVTLRVVAAPLGSWLDAVVAVRDEGGKLLAENDDPGPPPGKRGTVMPGPEPAVDSRVEFKADFDADLTVEVSDRYGRGGPEYGYRLRAGPDRPEIVVNARILRPVTPDFDLSEPNGPPGTGAYAVQTGGTVSVLCEVQVEGATGPITLRAEGLPEGVTSAPVTVRGRQVRPGPAQAILVLRAKPDAQAVSGRFRVVARASPEGGAPALERLATDTVRIDNAGKTSLARPVFRRISGFPIKVTESHDARQGHRAP